MTGADEPSLHVVFNVFRKTGEYKLEARAVSLRPHRGFLPLGGALRARVKVNFRTLKSDKLSGNSSGRMAAHYGIARSYSNVVEGRRTMGGNGPQLGRS